MKTLLGLLVLLVVCVSNAVAGEGYAIVFDGETCAGGASVTSGWFYTGNVEVGDYVIEGDMTSATPDHSITFEVIHCRKDEDGTIKESDETETINSTAITAEDFVKSFYPDYSSYKKIKATNGAGKETVTFGRVKVLFVK